MAEKAELKDIIVNIINDPDLTEDKIQDETRLIGEDGLFFDSIDVLELLVEIEKKYGIKISDNNIVQDHFTTFLNFYNFVLANEK
ncbi:MAG: phosphopantetheine-binding protein [Spirochaetes bacterium]|nr:phosphopantetheine-binding protein [Spirochaetota bacterium]